MQKWYCLASDMNKWIENIYNKEKHWADANLYTKSAQIMVLEKKNQDKL